MIDAEHSLHLEKRAIDLVRLDKHVLMDSLYGVRLLLVTIQVGKEDLTEGAFAYLQLNDKVLQLEGWLTSARLLKSAFRNLGLLLLVNPSGDCLSLLLIGDLGRLIK